MKDLESVKPRDVALMLFSITFLDNLDFDQKDYWHVKNIHNRMKVFMAQMQGSSKSLQIVYSNGHLLSDIAWWESKKEGPMLISPLALMVTFIDQHQKEFNNMLGDTSVQIKGIANKYYVEESLKKVQKNSWKIMKRLLSALNKVMYDSERDGNYLIMMSRKLMLEKRLDESKNRKS